MAAKKVPLRKCVVTKEMKPKKELIRIVRNKEGVVFIDETGKKNGRGAYLSKDLEIIKSAQNSGVLDRHLNAKIDNSLYEQLIKHMEGKEENFE